MKVTVNTGRYRRIPPTPPRGFGDWRFGIDDEVLWLENLTYSEARKRAIRKAMENPHSRR